MKIFTQLFHELCDAIESINQLFTFHLLPTMFSFLVIDIFGAYGIIREFMVTTNDANSQQHSYAIQMIIANVSYSIIQLIFKIWAANIGHSTRSEGEKTKVILSKMMNGTPPLTTVVGVGGHEVSTNIFYTALIQCQSRNLTLKNLYFIIDWNIVFEVMSFKNNCIGYPQFHFSVSV